MARHSVEEEDLGGRADFLREKEFSVWIFALELPGRVGDGGGQLVDITEAWGRRTSYRLLFYFLPTRSGGPGQDFPFSLHVDMGVSPGLPLTPRCATGWLSPHLPSLAPCTCLLRALPAGKGQEHLLRPAWQTRAGGLAETKPQNYFCRSLTHWATYPAPKSRSRCLLCANNLDFLNSFQSQATETNLERKDVCLLQWAMSP